MASARPTGGRGLLPEMDVLSVPVDSTVPYGTVPTIGAPGLEAWPAGGGTTFAPSRLPAPRARAEPAPRRQRCRPLRVRSASLITSWTCTVCTALHSRDSSINPAAARLHILASLRATCSSRAEICARSGLPPPPHGFTVSQKPPGGGCRCRRSLTS